ncbi:hypothetical protein GCM10023231_12590 [Olivibacter ginsenosidimutans]|uniref:Lysophospholipid acyltransferase family protein n=1 Tax=Olivibacter ginsenosidimutans TaxID=1176537 RepID=A0ABP9AWR7_9SPHI
MLNSYQNKLIELKERLVQSSWPNQQKMLNAYAFFSANLTHFMPSIPATQHKEWFSEAILNRQWNALDESFFHVEHPFTIHGWDNTWAKQLKKRPGLICTFHTGSYRFINYLLHRAGVPLALLIGDYAFREHRQSFNQMKQRLKTTSAHIPFSILNATDPKVAFKIKSTLEQGSSVLTYLDGYQGVQALTPQNAIRMPFLAQHQLLRKGLPYLAYKLNVPIYTVCCFRQADHSLRYVWLGPFEKLDMGLADFIDYTLYKIYSGFASYVQHYPAQWQNWSSLHLYANRNDFFIPGNPQQQIIKEPDEARHALLALNNDFFLLDKLTYQAYQIQKMQFNNLRQQWHGKSN